MHAERLGHLRINTCSSDDSKLLCYSTPTLESSSLRSGRYTRSFLVSQHTHQAQEKPAGAGLSNAGAPCGTTLELLYMKIPQHLREGYIPLCMVLGRLLDTVLFQASFKNDRGLLSFWRQLELHEFNITAPLVIIMLIAQLELATDNSCQTKK